MDIKQTAKEKISNTLQAIIEIFQTGNVPRSIAIATFPLYKDIPSNKWSLANRILMIHKDTCDARGYAQFHKIGRYPKKGAQAFYIVAPKMVKKENKKDEEESSDEAQYFLAGFIPVAVFRMEDTDGAEINYEPHELPNLPLLEKAKEWNISVKGISFHKKYYGYYRFGRNEQIRLASPHESVFFHELAHAAHKRVKGKLKNCQDPRQEIVAELTSQVLAHIVGTETQTTLGNSYEYIQSYANALKKDIGEACLSVLSETEKVLNLILA